MTRVVAIVPAWNEAGAIGGVVDEILAFDPTITAVVVDDASSDDTPAVAQALAARRARLPGQGMSAQRLVAIVPAWNEAGAIGGVIDEIRGGNDAIEVVVVDDASRDDTAAIAEAHGATVLRLPFNVGIGGAVQTGFRYALENGYERAVRLDGDGQHDASQIPRILAPIEAGEADLVIGSRFVDPESAYRPPLARRIG